MMRLMVAAFLMCCCGSVFGQTTAPAADDPAATAAITQLRQGLIEAFNKQDIDGVLSYLSPDVVVTWQDGRVCVGRDQVKAYYEEKMKGSNPIVTKITSDPQVDGRHLHDGWAVSYGRMNDHFSLKDGSELDMNSRFTATISRHGDRWLVDGFHLSVDAFNNPVLSQVGKKAGEYGVAMGGAGGLLIGLVGGVVMGRRKRKKAV